MLHPREIQNLKHTARVTTQHTMSKIKSCGLAGDQKISGYRRLKKPNNTFPENDEHDAQKWMWPLAGHPAENDTDEQSWVLIIEYKQLSVRNNEQHQQRQTTKAQRMKEGQKYET